MMKRFILSIVLLAMTLITTAQDFHFDEVTYTPEKTTFRLFAPKNAGKVLLRLYDDDWGRKPFKTVRMLYDNGIWTAEVKRNLKHRYYTFDMGNGECPGVFAKAVGVNGKRGYILDLASTDPEGWENDVRPVVKSPADLIIYEMHHRDFSVDESSGILNKGKFLALTEPKAIRHLKELGINAVHILPSYDFGSIDETQCDEDLYYEHAYETLPSGVIPARPKPNQYNWGYDPVNYNVPEGSYSTNPFIPDCRINEFKRMVQALHKAGIRVILDVVYNHTYDIGHSNFQRTFPDYFYRKTADGKYSNGSGCGNETASEQPMMRQFMKESVKYWINEYHIDGFRFDLMGIHDIETMNEIRQMVDEIDPTIFIYGEGWSAGQCAYPQQKLAMKANISKMPRIAAFSDELRDALRGPFSDDTRPGWLAYPLLSEAQGSELTESLKFGIAGAVSHPQIDMTKVNYSKEPWAQEPTQMISYVSCHDDMCLVDRLKASVEGLNDQTKFNLPNDQLIRLDLLAQTAVFTSQGIPFMLSGEEMLRTKLGVHNSYESPDSINRLDWTNLERYPQVFAYYKNLIQLRKHHPAFRLGSAELVRQYLEFMPTENGVVAFRLKDHAGGDTWKDIIVILNSNRESRVVDIPEDKYTVVACDGVINEQGLKSIEGSNVTVNPQSALIIYH